MKLKSLLATTLLLSAAYAGAATSTAEISGRVPSLGLQTGLDFESAQSPAQISSNSYTGFSVGVNLAIPLTESFALQPELNYVRRGLNLVDSGGLRANVYYHSLELPVFARMSFGERIRPYIFAGPMVIANISNSVEGSLGGVSASQSFNPKTLDFAAAAGVGLELGAFFVNARYCVGLINFNDNSTDWYSRGFRLMAGLQL